MTDEFSPATPSYVLELTPDYVFVNLWAEPVGRPLRYQAVAKLVARLRARTGIAFMPHLLRHATRDPAEVHSSSTQRLP